MTIGLTGATGALGRLVVDALLARRTAPESIVAIVRDPHRADALTRLGVQVRSGVYEDRDGVTAALEGVERLLLISAADTPDRLALHANVIDAATAAGVRFMAYTSAAHADTSTLPLFHAHAATEQLLLESGIPAAFLRNNWYSENYLSTRAAAGATGRLFTSARSGRVAPAARIDYAEAAAAVLLADDGTGVHELTGGSSWSMQDLADLLGTSLGREVALQVLPAAEYREVLSRSGLPAATVDLLLEVDRGIEDNALGDVSTTLADLIERPTTPLLETLTSSRSTRS